MGVWARRCEGTVIERDMAMVELGDAVEELDTLLPLAEYIYGYDLDWTFLLEDMAFDKVMVTSDAYESLCNRANQAFGLSNVDFDVDDFLMTHSCLCFVCQSLSFIISMTC